nr:unnamed protein product [Digitaria exilis]
MAGEEAPLGTLNLSEYAPAGARTVDCYRRIRKIGEGTYGVLQIDISADSEASPRRNVPASLTLRHVMDSAKQATKSGNLNELSMVLLNNILSLPLGIILVLGFNEVGYLLET